MNANYRKVPTIFGPETGFEARPAPPAPFRAAEEGNLARLKGELLAERLTGVWENDLAVHIRRAANEAEALAWVTRYPLLVFPALFEEKTEAAMARAERQREVLLRTRELLAV